MFAWVQPSRNAMPLRLHAASTLSRAACMTGGIWVAQQLHAAEREAEVAWPHLGKTQAGDGADFVGHGDPFRAFQFDTQQQFARRVERPGIAAVHVFLAGDAPDRRGGRLRAASARADTKQRPSAGWADGTLKPRLGGGQGRVDTLQVVRVPARFDQGADGGRGFSLTQQDAVHASPEYLPELPGAGPDMVFVDAIDRGLDDDGGGAMAGAGRSAGNEAAHVGLETGHVEAAVLHADVHVVGPGGGVLATLVKAEDVTAVWAVIVNRLILSQQLDGAVDPVGHGLGFLLRLPCMWDGRGGGRQAGPSSGPRLARNS